MTISQGAADLINNSSPAMQVAQAGREILAAQEGGGGGGTSFVWKGELASAPTGPSAGWAYFNTTDQKAYYYSGTGWDDMSAEPGWSPTVFTGTVGTTHAVKVLKIPITAVIPGSETKVLDSIPSNVLLVGAGLRIPDSISSERVFQVFADTGVAGKEIVQFKVESAFTSYNQVLWGRLLEPVQVGNPSLYLVCDSGSGNLTGTLVLTFIEI